MAYTSPRQWLDLLRRRPGSRFTDLGPAGNVLDATGGFMQRNSANPGRDWRSIMAEGEQRLQQSEAYGTPRSAISQTGTVQPTAKRESYTDILKQMPGSAARDPVDPLAGDVPQDPQGFLGKVGSFFTQPGVSDAMISGGAAMAQAASQPGASFWGSLGAGGGAALDQHNLMQQQQAARDKLTADAAATGLETAAEAQELEQRTAILNSWLDAAEIVDPAERARYAPFAVSDDTLQMARDDLGLTDDPTDLDQDKEKLAWYLGLSSDDQASYNLMRRNPPAGTTVNIEGDQAATPVGPAQAGMDTYVQGVYNGRATTFDSVMPSLQNVDRTLGLVNDPRFEEVAGVWSGNPIADALLRFEGDPELLAMLGTFERLGSDRALAILRNFTGAKSNFEFQVSEKMAAKDRSMTPAELRAMLDLMRRAYIQEAVRWAQSMVYMGEDVQIEGDYAAVQRRFMSDAQGILDEYGAEERSWRQAVDPAGIGWRGQP